MSGVAGAPCCTALTGGWAIAVSGSQLFEKGCKEVATKRMTDGRGQIGMDGQSGEEDAQAHPGMLTDPQEGVTVLPPRGHEASAGQSCAGVVLLLQQVSRQGEWNGNSAWPSLPTQTMCASLSSPSTCRTPYLVVVFGSIVQEFDLAMEGMVTKYAMRWLL